MQNFTFHNTTKIIFGRGQLKELKNNIKEDFKVMLVYGEGSIKHNGLYNAVMKELAEYDVVEFSGVKPNPNYEYVLKGVKVAKEESVDFVLAIGGGSVIDSAKFIALSALHNDDLWKLIASGKQIRKSLPIGVVSTISGSGSEANSIGVITKEGTRERLLFSDPLAFPKFAILDPSFTFTVPPTQISNGIIDSFTHIMERYLTYPSDTPAQDRMSESMLITLIEEGPKALRDPYNYDVRANLTFVSNMALNGLVSAGLPKDWTTHTIGDYITNLYGLDHAITLAILLPSVMEVMKKYKRGKLLQYAKRVWDINKGSEDDIVDNAIQQTRKFFESLGVNTRLSRYGIGYEGIKLIVDTLIRSGKLPLGEHNNIDAPIIEDILVRSL